MVPVSPHRSPGWGWLLGHGAHILWVQFASASLLIPSRQVAVTHLPPESP